MNWRVGMQCFIPQSPGGMVARTLYAQAELSEPSQSPKALGIVLDSSATPHNLQGMHSLGSILNYVACCESD